MLLEVQDLKTHFFTEDGVVRAVDGISFGLEEGRTLGIVGESGCGKSVTALTLMRLLAQPPARVVGGKILFRGQDLLALPEDKMRAIRGNAIGMIFQEPMTSLNPVYSIGYQIAEAVQIHRPGLSNAQIRERVVQMLRLVGMPEPERRFDDYPHQLSGGMRQRVMIAMALSCEPRLLIADEPTTALDVTIQAQILDLMKRLQREMGMGLILITHDLGVVAETVDDVMVMYAGTVVEKSPVAELFRQPLHPYTRGLLDSLPSRQTGSHQVVDGKKIGRLKGIRGMVPSPMNLPPGCRFQDRCQYVVGRCRESEPTLEKKAPGHWASCFEVKESAR